MVRAIPFTPLALHRLHWNASKCRRLRLRLNYGNVVNAIGRFHLIETVPPQLMRISDWAAPARASKVVNKRIWACRDKNNGRIS
jgi:hypothetical protein